MRLQSSLEPLGELVRIAGQCRIRQGDERQEEDQVNEAL